MYTHSLLIATSIIFVFIAPILYFNSLNKKKVRKEVQKLTQLAQRNSLNLDFSESLPNLLLGLDVTSQKFLVIELAREGQERIFEIGDLSSCEVDIDRRKAAGGINLVSLKLFPKVKSNPASEIVFYNEDLEVFPDAERRLQAAEKWKKILQANIDK